MTLQPSSHPGDQPGASPYARGARDGFSFGIYLSLMFLASVYSVSVPVLSLVTLVMFLAVPVLIYRYLRRAYVADSGTTLLSGLWMHGIMIFLCGSLLAGVVEVVWLKWLNPDFIPTQLKLMVDVYSSSGWERGEEMAELIEGMLNNGLVPSTISIVMEIIWLGVFTGSLLSVLMALLVRSRAVKQSID